MALTHRQARRKLGSRSIRRQNTNGKNIPNRPKGKKGQVAHMYRYPRPASRKVAVAVAKLVRDSQRKEQENHSAN